jgi:hypothetical protein
MEAVLRVPIDHPNYTEALFEAFGKLHEIYGNGKFEVCVTANAILRGDENGRYSIFYGQDFSQDEVGVLYNMTAPVRVRDLSEVPEIRTDFEIQDFKNIFFANRANTKVSVHALVNIIYIIRKKMTDYDEEATIGPNYQTLY